MNNPSFSDTLTKLDQELKKTSDTELIAQTVTAVREEREKVTVVLHYLREVDRRRLYSALKYKSLHHFATKHLHYTDDEAYRRIAAMKLLRALPEMEEKIVCGDLALSHLNMAQTFFNQEEKIHQKPMSKEDKIQVMEQMLGTSVREAEKITLSLSSSEVKIKPDKLRQVSKNQIEIRFAAREEVQLMIESLKGFLAHSHPGIQLGELFEKLCKLGLEQWDPSRPAKGSRKKSRAQQKPDEKAEQKANAPDKSVQKKQGEKQENFAASMKDCVEEQPQESAISQRQDVQEELSFSIEMNQFAQWDPSPTKSKARIRREVFQRAGNQCENCHSEYALEIDHIYPQAFGGSSDPDNLRLLCRHCNQRAAIESLGQQKMEIYLNS
jgi:hypothetical protein